VTARQTAARGRDEREGRRDKERKSVREKERGGVVRWGKESMFPKKKSSRERSRLGLPSWRNTRSSLILSFSLLSSAQLPTSSQLRTFTTSVFRPCLPVPFFFSRTPAAYVWKESFLSRGLSSRIPRLSWLLTTSIFDHLARFCAFYFFFISWIH